MSRTLRIAPLLLLAALARLVGCGDDGTARDCSGVICGPCATPVTIGVALPGGGAGPVQSSDPAIECHGAAGLFECSSAALAPGAHTVTLSAPGYAAQTLTFTLTPPGGGCCGCAGPFQTDLTLVPTGPIDAGADGASEAGADATSDVATDATSDASTDATTDASAACDPSVMKFPSGGSLAVGALCDDVFACVADASAAAALAAASSKFTCSAGPQGTCPGWSCRYAAPGGPSVLDAAEVAEICKVTLLKPAPAMSCVIYL